MGSHLVPVVTAAALAWGAVGCGNNPEQEPTPTTPTAEQAPSTTNMTLPPLTFSAVEAGDMTIRIIGVSDTESSATDTAEMHDRLATVPQTTAQMAAESTAGKLALNFLDPEYVKLDDVSASLCAAPTYQTWVDELRGVRDDAKELTSTQTGQAVDADITIFTYDFNTCPPDDTETSQTAGQADLDRNEIDLFRGAVLPQRIVHELGHELGFDEGNGADCPTTEPVIADKEACPEVAYGSASVMGNDAKLSHDLFSAYEYLRMQTIPAEQLVDVTVSGSFDLSALQNPDSGTKVLRVKASGNWLGDPDDPNPEQEYYYIYLGGQEPYYLSGSCRDGDAVRLDPTCIAEQRPALYVLRAPAVNETRRPRPKTLMFDLMTEFGLEMGAGYDKIGGPAEFTDPENGLTVELLALDYDSSIPAQGTGQVRITHP